MYRLTLTLAERQAFNFVSGRYAWGDIANCLMELPHGSEYWFQETDITFDVPEHIAWDIQALADEDTAGGHSRFPCASLVLADKLNSFLDSII